MRKIIDKKGIRLEYDRATAQISHNDECGRIHGYVRSKDEAFVTVEIFLQQCYGFIEAVFGSDGCRD